MLFYGNFELQRKLIFRCGKQLFDGKQILEKKMRLSFLATLLLKCCVIHMKKKLSDTRRQLLFTNVILSRLWGIFLCKFFLTLFLMKHHSTGPKSKKKLGQD